ncbi:unnamed protein product [Closterium sp. NIES-54]
MEFHEQKKQKYEEEQLKLHRQKVELLRNNDMEGYLNLVKNMKSDRVQNLLKETEAHLQRIAGRIASVRQQKGVVNGQDEGAEPDAGELSGTTNHLEAEKAYTKFLQKKSEIVQQPLILSGGKLREYQRDGLQWLVSLHANGLNGILADEMGLGKTVQVIALLCYLVEVKKIPGPFLIVAPASVLPNWVAEFARWAPSLRVSRYSGMPDKRAAIFSREINPWTRCPHNTGNDCGEAQRKWLEERGVANVVVTTYEMLMGKFDRPRLIRLSWEYVVLDEGHRIKSAECKLNAHLKSYKSNHRILLSGTPIQNNLEELWSLLNFLLPSVFNCASDFASWFSQPLSHVLPKKAGTRAQGGSADSEQEDVLGEEERLLLINRLHQVLRPFVLRRLKHKVRPCRLAFRFSTPLIHNRAFLVCLFCPHVTPAVSSICSLPFSLCAPHSARLPGGIRAAKAPGAPYSMCGVCIPAVAHSEEFQPPDDEEEKRPFHHECSNGAAGHLQPSVPLHAARSRGQQKAHAEVHEKKRLLLEEEKKKQQHQLAKGKQQKGKAEEGKGLSVQRWMTRRQQQVEAEQLTSQTTEVHASCSSSTPSASGSNPWNYFRLDGSTSGNEREELVWEFNKPDSDVFIFLLSVRAGGVGINLQAADTVIMYDTDWNPQIDLQAQARAHRIGQKNEVLVIRLETLQFLPFPGFPPAPAPSPIRQPSPGTTVSSTNITAQLSFNASATTTTNSPNSLAVTSTTTSPGGATVMTGGPVITPNTTGGPAATSPAPPAVLGPHGSLFPPVFPNPVTTAGGALLGAVGGATTGALAGAAAGAAAASGEGNTTGAGGAGQGAGVTGSGTTMTAVPPPAVLQPPPPLILPPAQQQQQLTPPLPPAQEGAGTAGGGFPGFPVLPAGNFAAGAVLGSALGAAAGTAAAAAGSAVASAAQSAAPTPPQTSPPQQQQVQSPAPPAAAVTPGGIVNETLNAVGELSGQGSVVVNGNEMQMQLRAGRGLQVVMGIQQLALNQNGR